jgi:hypothetical protein
MKSTPQLKLNEEQLNALLQRLEQHRLEPGDYEQLQAIVETLRFLGHQLQEKNFSIHRLRQMLFGAKTEKTDSVLNRDSADRSPAGSGQGAPKGKRPGHGRRPSTDYPGLPRVKVPHGQLKAGDRCPGCGRGQLYDTKRPAVLLHLRAQPIISGECLELEKLRCAACGQLFSATPPPEFSGQKYDPNVAPMLTVMRYGCGMPLHRFAQHQQDGGVPLPVGTQWELVQEHARELAPVWEEMLRQAADGELILNDDTTARILSLEKQIRAEEALAAENGTKLRTGIFTTGILSQSGSHPIALFFSGGQHAGENLQDVLDRRSPDLPPPIQMCDALSRNQPSTTPTRLGNCTAHGRRKFVAVADVFPEECRRVLETIKQVYRHDTETRHQSLSAQQRLHFHQQHSGPLMADLKKWMEQKIEHHEVEPNSSLGEAIHYMLKHWEPLTLFLREPGAPLDSNPVERILKVPIRHRNNSLFYKTQNGAAVGDLFMSLITTCRLARVNPFDYLSTLRRHLPQVRDGPAAWMPWNYQATVAALAASRN